MSEGFFLAHCAIEDQMNQKSKMVDVIIPVYRPGKEFEKLVNKLLESNSPKKWFRAYFNHGLINYIFGQKRLAKMNIYDMIL